MRFLPAGHSAVLIEVDDLDQVTALQGEVNRRRDRGWAPSIIDVVAGARTLLLDGVDDIPAMTRALRSWSISPVAADEGPTIEVGCRYDGPDLPDVAAQWALSVAEAIELHSSILHSVAFCGFGPGFAYLAGLGEDHAVTRRETPRTSVPAGSVAVAGPYTGIYPRPSPGGWQLIGHTDAVIWDEDREAPALLVPGRRVRFVDVGAMPTRARVGTPGGR